MRKPVEDLNAADLEQFVWVFGDDDGGDDEDETWVQSLSAVLLESRLHFIEKEYVPSLS